MWTGVLQGSRLGWSEQDVFSLAGGRTRCTGKSPLAQKELGKLNFIALMKRSPWVWRARGEAHSLRLPRVSLYARDFGAESNGWSTLLKRSKAKLMWGKGQRLGLGTDRF